MINRIIALTLVIITLLLLPTVVCASFDDNPWLNKFNDLDTQQSSENNGDGYVKPKPGELYGDSGWYAWGDGYVLSGYLGMYEAYRNQGTNQAKTFLDKFIADVDEMLLHTQDIYNDGYDGWWTSKYSMQRVNNSDLEDTANPYYNYMPRCWYPNPVDSTSVYKFSVPAAQSGTWAICTLNKGVSWTYAFTYINGYQPNTKYKVKFYSQAGSTGSQGTAYIYDATAEQILGSQYYFTPQASGIWQEFGFDVTMPAASGHTLELRIGNRYYQNTTDAIYFDTVSVQQYTEYMVHDGFIWYNIAKFITLVNEDPNLSSSYQDVADSYKDLLVNNWIPKWDSLYYSINSTRGVYMWGEDTDGAKRGDPKEWDDTPETSPLSSLPNNMYCHFGRMLLWAYKATGTTSYLDRATKLANNLKYNLHMDTGTNSYYFHYLDNNGTTGDGTFINTALEDMIHGQTEFAFARDCYDAGIVFDTTDMVRFQNMYRSKIWNQSISSPVCSYFVNGTWNQGDTMNYAEYVHGFAEMSAWSEDIWQEISQLQDDVGYQCSIATSYHRMDMVDEMNKWDRKSIRGGTFENKSATDSTLPAQWTRMGDSANSVIDSSNKYLGKYGIKLTSTGGNWQGLYQSIDYIPSKQYTITFYGKTWGAAANGIVYFYDYTTSSIVGSMIFTGNTWTKYTFNWTAPSVAGHNVKIFLCHQYPNISGGYAAFDEIRMRHSDDPY